MLLYVFKINYEAFNYFCLSEMCLYYHYSKITFEALNFENFEKINDKITEKNRSIFHVVKKNSTCNLRIAFFF